MKTMTTILAFALMLAACAMQPDPPVEGAADDIQQPPPSCASTNRTTTGRSFTQSHISLFGGALHGGVFDPHGTWLPDVDGDTFDLPLVVHSGERIEDVTINVYYGANATALTASLQRYNGVFDFSTDLGTVSAAVPNESAMSISHPHAPGVLNEDVANGDAAYFIHITYSGFRNHQTTGVGSVQLTTSVLGTTTSPGC